MSKEPKNAFYKLRNANSLKHDTIQIHWYVEKCKSKNIMGLEIINGEMFLNILIKFIINEVWTNILLLYLWECSVQTFLQYLSTWSFSNSTFRN